MTDITLGELVESIYALGQETKIFEKKYGLTSEDFYDLFRRGLLDDGEYKETEEFCRWAGLYEIRCRRERQFQELSRKTLEQLKSSGEFIQLSPRLQPVED